MTKKQQSERDEQIAALRETLKPGDTVYTVLRSVSRSGMQRMIDVYAICDNEPMRLTWSVGIATQYTYSRKAEALKVDGCGMDMGFAVVYSLGRALYPNGFALPEGQRGRNGDTSGFDTDGGYALNHRWM